MTPWYGSVCNYHLTESGAQATKTSSSWESVMCACVCVVQCEIMRLLARRTGTLKSREVMGWMGRETRDVEEGKEMKQNHIKLQKGRSNINRVRRLNRQRKVRLKSEKRGSFCANSLQSSQTVYLQLLLGVSVYTSVMRALTTSHGSPVSLHSRWALHF